MQATSAPDSTTILAGFHALSDPLRLAVIELLRSQELCVCDLCDRLNVQQSKLSFHLKTLKQAGLIRPRQQGRWMYYSLNLPQFVVLEQYLAEFRRTAVMVPTRSCCSD
ncbi:MULTISPECIES: metalloregulator ArsR/SmtB family transcription factor [Moorena]|uniref:Transcriptional regulator, ArsR family n=1 Tax=Moorena producens 3L TaxID=489825 RepID=F4XUW9_9CYAN|nr:MULTISPECIES: metalloregulator ArsR/SmtB family transcription factor [Moorena]NEQ15742.1 winged helix-turn-helix transcriptional regulator [Moorena sp. SIO3E2]EGJ31672.1 transcriptional regulator, ArsR family [Moorena producens 3L]NEO74896.1 winged helix-turn-helix transcriptional regulator [Moorena sp. SIO4G3]NEP32100.1 winged helix-turn-helix transcriptional regulator [Moorena sp. SIO3B2]NEP70025.1 winged helix-turn-helix transcriptional regulator [Moorena sp. SIO3A5]